jgi:hypothetical protein
MFYKRIILQLYSFKQISYGELLTIIGTLRIVEINEWFCRILVRYFVAPLFPALISYEQFQLMFNNNTTHSDVSCKILGRHLQSTKLFWKENL